jgi:hypothetical protein
MFETPSGGAGLLLLLALATWPMRVGAAAPQSLTGGPIPIKALEPDPAGRLVVFWTGEGRCGTELPSPARLAYASQKSPNWSAVHTEWLSEPACDGLLQGLTSSSGWAYYAQGGGLWRVGLGYGAGQGVKVPLAVNVTGGYQPGALAVWGDSLYWTESNGLFFKLWKSDRTGGQQRYVLAHGGGRSEHCGCFQTHQHFGRRSRRSCSRRTGSY